MSSTFVIIVFISSAYFCFFCSPVGSRYPCRVTKDVFNIREEVLHWPSKCLVRVACLRSTKMPMFQRAGMTEGGLPLPRDFQNLILMT